MRFTAHRCDNLLRADSIGFECLRIQVEIDLALGAAHHRDRPHTPHIFQASLEGLVGPIGELHRTHRRGSGKRGGLFRQHGHRPHRFGCGVKPQHPGFLHFSAQGGADGCHFLTYIVGRLAPVHRQIKFNDDDRLALVAAGGQRIDSGDRVDTFFNFLGNFAFNDFGRGTGIVGNDNDHREIDVGKLIDLKTLE